MDAVHPRVLGYLGRALSLELSAVQQYMTQAALVEGWGDGDAAQRFRQETVEEMRHAETIVKRMLTLGVAPAASQLRPAGHGRDLVGLLRQNMVLEDELVNLYAEAVRFCLLVGDGESEAFFRQLWSDEQHHAEELAVWLQSLGGRHERHLERATF
ncbi:MAG: ferritin-like domain-containing protein [Synechococcaceae cyanobacterium]